MGLMFIIPTQLVSIRCGCLTIIFSTVVAPPSPLFCGANFLPLKVLKSLDSKRNLTSYLVREHRRNASHTNTESRIVTRRSAEKRMEEARRNSATAEPLEGLTYVVL